MLYHYCDTGAEEVKEYAITRNPDNTRCGETITETVDAVSFQTPLCAQCNLMNSPIIYSLHQVYY